MKQTAVEWLFEKLWDEPKDKFTWYALRKKAIEMEKEQIIEANADGQYLNSVSLTKRMCLDGAECYYNETYGGDQ